MRGVAAIFLASLALAVFPARAAVRCVGTAQELQQAVADAKAAEAGSVWDIRVRQGTYTVPGGLDFATVASFPADKQFTLLGGYTAGCSPSQRARDPDLTVVKAGGGAFAFRGKNRKYDIESIRFEGFAFFDVRDDDGLTGGNADSLIVVDNHFDSGGSVLITSRTTNHVAFRGNLVTGITALEASPVDIWIDNNEASPDIGFNTMVDLDCQDSSAASGLTLHSRNPTLKFHHNIIWSGACTYDIYNDTSHEGKVIIPYNNLYGNQQGGFPVGSGNIVGSDPQFVDAAGGNFDLAAGSPAVDGGMNVAEMASLFIPVPTYDLHGNTRPVLPRFDIGAYERQPDVVIPSTFTVTNISDSGPGSLRDAILQANADAGYAQTIKFAIPGGCPRTIALQSPLPDVTDTLFVLGYTQPFAQPNTLAIGSDANVCVVLTPASSGVAHAMRVPSGQVSTQLTVEGLGFGSGTYTFTSAAVRLQGGNGHKVRGSVFGGEMPPQGHIHPPLGNLQRGIMIGGFATGVVIGGENEAERNYFGGLQQNAIVLNDGTTANHVIENNYFGLMPDGKVAQPNMFSAISASGGSGVHIMGNVIAAGGGCGIHLLNESVKSFFIQENRIGVNAIGVDDETLANSAGICIAGGSKDHVIGADVGAFIDSSSFSNDIRNNNGAGIRIDPTAGAGTVIRGNRISSNGRSGTGLGIDLDLPGQLQNDDGDGDAGPNGLQNHPMIVGSTPHGENGSLREVVLGLNTTPGAYFVIDVYRSSSCPQGQKGANATTYVGGVDGTAVGSGNRLTFDVSGIGAPGYLTATATTADGTSEFSPCFSEDTIFRDGLERPGL
jgi:hypothetical protein